MCRHTSTQFKLLVMSTQCMERVSGCGGTNLRPVLAKCVRLILRKGNGFWHSNHEDFLCNISLVYPFQIFSAIKVIKPNYFIFFPRSLSISLSLSLSSYIHLVSGMFTIWNQHVATCCYEITNTAEHRSKRRLRKLFLMISLEYLRSGNETPTDTTYIYQQADVNINNGIVYNRHLVTSPPA